MGKKEIHDVAAGEAETDAVNVGQLNSAVTNIGSNMNYLGNQINKLDNRVNRVGAGQTTNYGSSQAMAQEIDNLRGVVNDQQSMIQS